MSIKFTLPKRMFDRGVVGVDLDARLRPAHAARLVGVSRQLMRWWYTSGLLQRGDDGTVRLGDVLAVERDTRRSPRSRRSAVRSMAG